MWDILWYVMLALYIPACIGLIVVVLLQKGKGVGFAGAFGIGGGSDTVFGPRMNKSLPQRLTHAMAAIFMILALCMSLVSGRLGKGVAPDKAAEEMTQTDFSALDDLGSGLEQDMEGPAATEDGAGSAVPTDADAVTVTPVEVGTVTVTPAETAPDEAPETSADTSTETESPEPADPDATANPS